MPQCLDLVNNELRFLEVPLTLQRDREESRGEKDEDPDDLRNCCGPLCSARGCFNYLLLKVVGLRGPINQTLANFNGTVFEPEGAARGISYGEL